MAQRIRDFVLEGGLDLATQPIKLNPGKLIGVINYEPGSEGGYTRLTGYERFDGLPSPSDADYWLVYFLAGSIAVNEGDELTGLTSGTTAKVLSVVIESGNLATHSAAGHFIVFNVSGLYSNGEALQVSTVSVATASDVSAKNNENDGDLYEKYTRLAREARRADIAQVPGSGDIRGIWSYNGTKYAFRDNASATACDVYKSSPTGWKIVSLGFGVDFTAGTEAFKEGEVLTGVLSGATAVLVSVGVTLGSWSANDAVGRLYLKAISGTFIAENITSINGSANIAAAQTPNVIPVGGHYEFVNHNFYGQLSTRQMWGVNGVGHAFRFDGTEFSFIHITGASVDAPKHLKAHQKHLFLTLGSSMMISSIGRPLEFDAITGAAEIATGDTIVGLDTQPGGVLSVFNRNSTYILYGNDATNWDLKEYSIDRGAIEWSLQNVMRPLYLDDRGLMFLNPVQDFGDFRASSISELIDPLIQLQKGNVLSSVRIKDKDQYRLFFKDGSGLIAKVHENGAIEYTSLDFGLQAVCCCAEENAAGQEEVFFGSTDGFVYQMEKGASFDGRIIEYFARLPFYSLGSSRQKKRFHKATIQIDAVESPDLNFFPEFSYGSSDQPKTSIVNIADDSVNTGGGYWGDFIWGDFIWDGQVVGEADAYLSGTGINISLTILGESNYQPPHTLQGVTYHYSMRGLKR